MGNINNSYFNHFSKVFLCKQTLTVEQCLTKIRVDAEINHRGMHRELYNMVTDNKILDCLNNANMTNWLGEIVYVPVFYLKCGVGHKWKTTSKRTDTVYGTYVDVDVTTTTTTQHAGVDEYDMYHTNTKSMVDCLTFNKKELLQINNPEALNADFYAHPSTSMITAQQAHDLIYKHAKSRAQGVITDFEYFCRCYLVPVLRIKLSMLGMSVSIEVNMHNGKICFSKYELDPVVKRKASKYSLPAGLIKFSYLLITAVCFLVVGSGDLMNIKIGKFDMSILILLMFIALAVANIVSFFKIKTSKKKFIDLISVNPERIKFRDCAKSVIKGLIIYAAISVVLVILVIVLHAFFPN